MAVFGAAAVGVFPCSMGLLGCSAAFLDAVRGFAGVAADDLASELPWEANGWSKTMSKYTVYVFPAPQKRPLVTCPLTSVFETLVNCVDEAPF